MKGYVKTNIFLTAYDDGFVRDLIKELEKRNYRILEFSKSEVVDYFYYLSVEGNAKEIEELIKGNVPWYRVEVLEFT